VAVAGQESRTAGETLYYLPMPLSATGRVTFTPDLMRSSLVEVNAQVFNRDPLTLTVGGGSVTLAYRPIPVAGRLVPSRLAFGFNLGQVGPIGPAVGKPLEPGAPATTTPAATPGATLTPATPGDTPAASPGAGEATSGPVLPAQPAPPPAVTDPNLPGIELFDLATGTWRPIGGVVSGKSIEIREPARFVDPSSGTVLVRLGNGRPDALSIQLAVQLEGEMR
jgi:hypothetical protein